MCKVENPCNDETMAVYHGILSKSTRGKLGCGALGVVVDKLRVNYGTIHVSVRGSREHLDTVARTLGDLDFAKIIVNKA